MFPWRAQILALIQLGRRRDDEQVCAVGQTLLGFVNTFPDEPDFFARIFHAVGISNICNYSIKAVKLLLLLRGDASSKMSEMLFQNFVREQNALQFIFH